MGKAGHAGIVRGDPRPARTRAAIRFMALACGLALAAGCVSVPLSTLWEMRRFGPQDLLQLERPAAAVKTLHLHVALRLGTDRAWLPLFDGVAVPVGARQTL